MWRCQVKMLLFRLLFLKDGPLRMKRWGGCYRLGKEVECSLEVWNPFGLAEDTRILVFVHKWVLKPPLNLL